MDTKEVMEKWQHKVRFYIEKQDDDPGNDIPEGLLDTLRKELQPAAECVEDVHEQVVLGHHVCHWFNNIVNACAHDAVLEHKDVVMAQESIEVLLSLLDGQLEAENSEQHKANKEKVEESGFQLLIKLLEDTVHSSMHIAFLMGVYMEREGLYPKAKEVPSET